MTIANQRCVSAAYGTDLAFVHDVGFGDFARAAAPFLVALLQRRGIGSARVVDLGSGSGILAAALCRKGYRVLGIDLSASMIRLARRRAPRAVFRRDSFVSARLPECEAVTALGECLNYAFDSRVGRRTIPAFFRRVHRVLAPRGVFVFDIATPGRGAGPAIRYHAGDGWVVIAHMTEDAHRHVLTRRITAFRRVGRRWRRSDEVHRLRLYRRDDVRRWLETAGFDVGVLHGYGRLRFPRGWLGFVASPRHSRRI